jgi:Pyridoxamine 5'-phosphate oxidase
MEAPRSTRQRQADARAILDSRPPDVWVASASPAGEPHLVPLSFAWDGDEVTLAVKSDSTTARNIVAADTARLGFGTTRDVVMVDAVLVTHTSAREADEELVDHYLAKARWNPKDEDDEYVYLVLQPQRMQVWREANELAGRTVMRAGRWVE